MLDVNSEALCGIHLLQQPISSESQLAADAGPDQFSADAVM
jgi:hypothetical protein